MSTKPMLIEIECPKCGYQRSVTKAQIVAGSWRSACPVCHPEVVEPPAAAGSSGERNDAGTELQRPDVAHESE